MKLGTEKTQKFYDEKGWTTSDGQSVDAKLFGVREDGPIRQAAYRLRVERLRAAIGSNVNLLECGCGGHPNTDILDLCSHYTGVDFSATGIALAGDKLKGIPHRLDVADFTALPYADSSFDVVYCAHAIYHIEDPAGQKAALAEMLRVVRSGGKVIVLAANPRPLAFPVRALKRLVADLPVISGIANQIRKKPPLPYRPMPIRWMKRHLGGNVRLSSDGMAPTDFNHRVTEFRGWGRIRWNLIARIERDNPVLAAYLGTFVMFEAEKR